MNLVQPPATHLAQLNVGRALDAMESARMAGFMANLDRVNALAERSPGFVWRLTGDGTNNATDVKLTDDPLFIVNLSVWETPAALEHFVWNTVHKRFYDQKAKWFAAAKSQYFVMWWVPTGHRPSPHEALEKLAQLQRHGPTADIFGWESVVDMPLHTSRSCA